MGKNFDKSIVLREQFSEWKEHQQKENRGFYPIFNEFLEYLPNLSGGAALLYLYFGLHSKNKTGESYHDMKTIAKFFNKTTRTVREWCSELEDKKLIKRMQVKYNGVTYTYLYPYGANAKSFLEEIEKGFVEIEKKNYSEDEDSPE